MFHCGQGTLEASFLKEQKLVTYNDKDKVETLLSTGNPCPASNGVKSKMRMQSKKCLISLNGKCDLEFTNEQIIFYHCFNVHDFSEKLSVFKIKVSELCSETGVPETVLKLFMGMRTGKTHALVV